MLLLPSVEVTKGEPQPPLARVILQPLAVSIVGGLVPVIRNAEMTASPSLQLLPVPDVLPVITNGFIPSVAIPPTPHIAPPRAPALVAAAHAVTVDGSSMGTPTSQPCQRLQSLMLP